MIHPPQFASSHSSHVIPDHLSLTTSCLFFFAYSINSSQCCAYMSTHCVEKPTETQESYVWSYHQKKEYDSSSPRNQRQIPSKPCGLVTFYPVCAILCLAWSCASNDSYCECMYETPMSCSQDSSSPPHPPGLSLPSAAWKGFPSPIVPQAFVVMCIADVRDKQLSAFSVWRAHELHQFQSTEDTEPSSPIAGI